MLQDISNHIALADESLAWAGKYGKNAFPQDLFMEYRRRLRRIRSALSEKCSVAAYGESQVGKSYLMNSLLSSPSSPFEILNAGRTYSFIDDINPSGGNTAKVESTGVITRFTLSNGNPLMRNFVMVRNLSVVDIILLLTDSYYNDVKINQDNVLRYDDINRLLEGMSHLWGAKTPQQSEIHEDDIKDIAEYVHDVIGNAASGINQSSFCQIVAPVIQYVSYDKWVDIFSLLWNKNEELSHLFSVLINEYKKLGFNTEIYVPFDAVLREKGTLLKIEWLDTVCGVNIDTGNDEIYTNIYSADGNILTRDFHKGYLSALAAELTFELPESIADERPFLHKLDLLDFPGARSREKFKEQEIHAVLPKILRRGKVAYLFNKYSRSLRISSVLFCHHNDQKAEATIGETINSWIEDNIGATPAERAEMLSHTGGIAPLFLVATKFNIDLERTKTDSASNADKLDEHWNRFNTVLPEIIKPNRWLDEWVKPGGIFRTAAFQNIYPLRDFYWSGKNGVFEGYSDGDVKSPEKSVHEYADYPDYFSNLKNSFLRNDFVRRHFANPETAWNDVATVNNDGSKAIIRNLNSIAGVLDDARRKKYRQQLLEMKQAMYNALSVYFEPEDKEEKNRKVKQIAGDIKFSLAMAVGNKPETFGKIIDTLMVPVGRLRDIAYDIIVCHTDTPKDFTKINFVRMLVGINPADGAEANIKKLCDNFSCDVADLEEKLNGQGCTIEDVVANDTETLTTVADVVAKHMIDYWNSYVHSKVKVLEPMLPHSEDVVFMLSSLLEKMNVRKVLSERIDRYCKVFSQNEQPNVIADFASLTLNNFVSSVGRDYISEDEVGSIRQKAEKCHVSVNLDPSAWNIDSKPQPLLVALNALDAATEINTVDQGSLMRLPFWSNFQRWLNLVTIGLLYASDISHVDPVANAAVKKLMDECDALYKSE